MVRKELYDIQTWCSVQCKHAGGFVVSLLCVQLTCCSQKGLLPEVFYGLRENVKRCKLHCGVEAEFTALNAAHVFRNF